MTRMPIWTRAATAGALVAALALPAAAQEAKPPAAAPPNAPTRPGAAAAAQQKAAAAVTIPFDEQALESDQQKTLYALGLALSQSLGRLDLQGSELRYLVQGLQDGVLQRTPRVPIEQYATKVQELAQSRLQAASARELVKANDFLAKMAGEKGAVKTDSGLVFIAEQEGTGPNPKASDTVRVNYEGTLPDGTVFDSSIQRGQPASFPLDQVIPCWTEALQRMKVGGRAKVVCPASLAYGEEGRPGIPPNSPLVFEIHLLGIGDTATASPGQGQTEHPPLLQQVAAMW
jgi:FKBP-type peptidyl-prolyl cis-trans isomerase